MCPLLNREEINALLGEPKASRGEPPNQVTIDLGCQRVVLQGSLSLAQGTVIELNQSLEGPYEIRANDKLFAYGKLVALDGRVVIQIAYLAGQSHEAP